MADRFFDTSAAKHYRAEPGTARVDAFLGEAGSRHFLSELGVVELHAGAPLDAFVTADANLFAVARLEGLNVVNPEVP